MVADGYSPGVLLYELLTGRPPFDPKEFAEAGVEGIRQQIREIEPARPSDRLSTLDDDERTTIAQLRNTAAAELSLILRGDLLAMWNVLGLLHIWRAPSWKEIATDEKTRDVSAKNP